MALFEQFPAQLACTHEWKVQMQLVDCVHHRQVCCAGGLGQVVHSATTDVQQLGLAAYA